MKTPYKCKSDFYCRSNIYEANSAEEAARHFAIALYYEQKKVERYFTVLVTEANNHFSDTWEFQVELFEQLTSAAKLFKTTKNNKT